MVVNLQLPCPTDTTMVYMVYRPMQCHLREYVCTDARLSMSWEDSDPENDSCRAWFPQDVEFEETVVSTISLCNVKKDCRVAAGSILPVLHELNRSISEFAQYF